MATAEQVLKIAQSQIGYKESPKNSNKTKYGKAYGMNGQSWCAIFVWWVFNEAGCPELFFGGKKSAYCPTIADFYIAKKQTVSKGSGKPGDIVLFDWNHSGASDHIGIIEKKNSDGTYTCIEGNTSLNNNSNGGQVMRRKRYQSQISWICRPKYSNSTTTVSTTTKKTGKLVVDGEWGKTTTTMTQKVFGVSTTGTITGQLTSCKKYLPAASADSWKFASSSKNGAAVIKEIQKLVGVTRDGKAGKKTVMAMQKFLNKKGYSCGTADGVMGAKTVKAWQKYINSRLK